MNKENYNNLKDFVARCYEESHAGLNTLLKSDSNFRLYMERKYRLNAYRENGDLFMTANERHFHLIGFIDAIIFFERAHQIPWMYRADADFEDDSDTEWDDMTTEDYAEIEEQRQEGKKIRQAINSVVISVETGEDD